VTANEPAGIVRCYSLAEAAKQLSLSAKTLREWLAKNPGYHATPRRKIIISADDLARIYEAMRSPAFDALSHRTRRKPTPAPPSDASLYRRLAAAQAKRKKDAKR
jgi:hypothetical protein